MSRDSSIKVVGEKRSYVVIDTIVRFKDWLKIAKKGDSIVYYQGSTVYNPETNSPVSIAQVAYKSYEKGDICLTQERFWPAPDGQFNYIATRR